jgi:probable O-glycosylation ligase (exosortase A-associated)
MLRSLFISLVFLGFIAMGAAAPFVFSLGYVWVDTFRPQEIATLVLPSIPVSMVMGALAIGSYIVADRRSPAPVSTHTVLILLFAAWVTVTTLFFAVSPPVAWEKYDWAIKTLLFSAFIPLVFRTRVQIEAFLQVYLFALAIHIMPFGIKTLVNGGGYGSALGIVAGNSGFSEGSTLAAVALMLVPFCLYFIRHSVLMPQVRLTQMIYYGMLVLLVACAFGTFARTTLVGVLVLGIALWIRSRRKIVGAAVGVLMVMGMGIVASDAWEERISTVQEYQSESSALGRILVWKWTLGFVASNPAGGGFNSYVASVITFPGESGQEDVVVHGKAFHSIYFEVLGEHGWPGIILFGGLIATSLLSLQRVARRAAKVPGMEHCRDLAYAMQTSLLCLLACGAFIGIAFQPMLYYLFALSACLSNYLRRTLAAAATLPAEDAPLGQPVPAATGGWRDRGAVQTAFQPPAPRGGSGLLR